MNSAWGKLVLATVLCAGAGTSWWLARQADAPVRIADTEARHRPDFLLDNPHTTALNELGKPRYELRARWLAHYADDGSITLERPELLQYVPGKAPTRVRGDRGTIPRGGERIHFDGNVVVTHGTGGTVRTNTLTVQLDR